MTIAEWLETATQRLERAGIESARLEAQLISAHIFRRDRTWVIVHGEETINEIAAESLLQRRESREPLAYILGWREFFGHRFTVRPGVLIPRQDTEILVEAAIDLVKGFPDIQSILEVGVGSGCIAISLARELRRKIVGVDVSVKALDVAMLNAHDLNADVEFLHSDGFEAVTERSFDLIVSNPPYIREDEALMPEVGQFEPREALFAGPDGLDAYRWLAHDGLAVTRVGSWMVVEIGMGMGDEVRQIFESEGWTYMRSVNDLSGIERVLGFRRLA